jgi:hypothetical protein
VDGWLERLVDGKVKERLKRLVEVVTEEGEFFVGGLEEKWPKERDLRRFAVETVERHLELRLVSARALGRLSRKHEERTST